MTGGLKLPREITDEEEFLAISERADECRIKRTKDKVKLKLRTKSQLYTLVVPPERADSLIQKIKCAIREV